MLDEQQQRALNQLLEGLNDAQRLWLASHLHEITAQHRQPAVNGHAALPLHVFYATETGNTKVIAQSLDKQARLRGFKTTISPLSRVKPADLTSKGGPIIVLTSTHGEGDPPEMAKRFFDALNGEGAISFNGLRYAVMGLGDRSYAQFCSMAVTLDKILQARGGQPFHPLATFDVDYSIHTPGWIDQVLGALHEGPAALHVPAVSRPHTQVVSTKGTSRLSPATATIRDIVKLSDIGSRKETYHIELECADRLAYNPGDSLGILLPPELDDKKPVRLYSIASSPLCNENAIHLTVALSTYTAAGGSIGYGLCSRYLTRLAEGEQVQCFIQQNQRFRLPEDDAQDVIMIGPGTGIAPFRAFLQERAERNATGRNWLFFGEQHAHCDFLYQSEWQDYLDNGILTHMNVAFSRDQRNKVYVQDRMREKSAELLNWIDAGARIYVCGSKSPMSEDVEDTLLSLIAARHGGKEKARDMLDHLAEEDRYLKDVY